MNSRKETPATERSRVRARKAYRAPVLQDFGRVTDLTNGARGSCQDDGNNCPNVGPGNMAKN